MKKFVAIGAFALLLVGSYASAALVVTPTQATTEAEFAVDCTNDGDYYAIYNVSTLKQVTAGECDGTAITINNPGNYRVLVSASDINGTTYENVTIVEQDVIQVTPSFASANSGNAITADGFVGFIGSIGAFFVSNAPALLSALAALIGLGVVYRLVRKWIGRRF